MDIHVQIEHPHVYKVYTYLKVLLSQDKMMSAS